MVKTISTKGSTKDVIDKFSILDRAKYLSLRIFQNYLAYMLAIKDIKYFNGTTQISSQKSNGISEESNEKIIK